MNLAIVVATAVDAYLQLWVSTSYIPYWVNSDGLAKYEGVYYRLAYRSTTPTPPYWPKYRIIKSTDNGATWSYADAVEKSVPGYNGGTFFHDHYIYYYFSEGVTWGVDAGHMWRWDLETKAWDSGFEVLLPYSGAYPGSPDMGDGTARFYIRARSDGSFVAVYKELNYGEYLPAYDEWWYRVYYRVYSGGVWSAPIYIMGAGQRINVNLGSVVVGVDDRVHVVLVTEEDYYNAPTVTKAWAVTVEADNTIGAPVLLTASPDTSVNPNTDDLLNPWFIGRGAVSSTVVAFSMRVLDGAIPKLAVAVGNAAGTTWALETVSSNVPPVWDDWLGHWAMPLLADGSVVYAIWSGPEYPGNHYLYGRKRAAGGTWGTEETLIDGNTDPVLASPCHLQDVSLQLVADGTMTVSGWCSTNAESPYGTQQPYFGILTDALMLVGCRYHGF